MDDEQELEELELQLRELEQDEDSHALSVISSTCATGEADELQELDQDRALELEQDEKELEQLEQDEEEELDEKLAAEQKVSSTLTS